MFYRHNFLVFQGAQERIENSHGKRAISSTVEIFGFEDSRPSSQTIFGS